MGSLINLSGQRFGRLVVLDKYRVLDKHHVQWLCKCDCTNELWVRGDDLKSGAIQSCKCLKKERGIKANTIHGHALKTNKSRTYHSWDHMIQRCTNPKNTSYEYYGGRGISVCTRWLNSFENFLEDMGERPEGTSIDRINNDGNYEPNNCRWATKLEQLQNRRKKYK